MVRRKKAKRKKRKSTTRPKPRKHDDDNVEGTDELPPSGGPRTIGERAASNGN